MILQEFAVNPDAIKAWRDLNTITISFGFPNGAVISLFPKDWIGMLRHKAEVELKGKAEYLRVIEKLNIIKKDILIKSGRDFDPKHDWINNSIMQHEKKPFYKILHTEGMTGRTEIIGFDLLDGSVFEDLREGKIRRNAASFADASRLLLVNSKNIQFIDPYFSAKNKGFAKSLQAMLNAADAFQRQNIASIQFHTSYKQGNTEVNIEDEKESLDKYYKQIIPAGQQIEFFWWDDKGTAEIHPRYLITERGGIRFDRGFVEPNDLEQQQTETDVSMMKAKVVTDVSQKYKEDSSPYRVIDKHTVHGEGKRGQ